MAKESIEEQPEAIPLGTAGASGAELITSPVLIVEEPKEKALPSERRQLAKSATIVMLGNLASSLMGLVRQTVVAATGASIAGPFTSALSFTQTFIDLLANGTISGALIPTFTDYAATEKRDELRRVVFTMVNLVLLVMFVVAAVSALFLPQFINILVSGFTNSEKLLTVHFAQIIFFSMLALGPFAVLSAALYALRDVGWPAFAPAAYHVGIVIGAIVGSFLGLYFVGPLGLAYGVLLGALGEVALLIPGIRNQHLGYFWVLDLKHPAVRRIFKLYAPVALSFLVSMGLVFFDQNLASRTPCDPMLFPHAFHCGTANSAAMRLATTLIQFPVGLVVAALSFAVLPMLSAHATAGDDTRFKETLLLGIRVGLLLMIPAAVGLIVLRGPIVDLIFMHHNYTAQNAALTAIALQNYAYQLPFVAIDQLLLAAFYARKNTITPVTVGILGVLWYLAVALPLWQTVGMPALVLANTVQNSMHPVIMFVLLWRMIGPIKVRETLPALLKILVSAAAMVAVAWGMQVLLGQFALFSLQHLLGQLLTVIVAGGLAGLVYIGGVLVLKVEEVGLVKGAVLAKLGRK